MTLHPGIRDCDFLISIGTQTEPDNYINRYTITVKHCEAQYIIIHNNGEHYHQMKLDSSETKGTVAFLRIILRHLLYKIADSDMRNMTVQMLTLDETAFIDVNRQLECMANERTAKEKREALIKKAAEIVLDWLVSIKTLC